MDGGEWAAAHLAVELSEPVPDEIRGLFGVAREAMLYGWFFYRVGRGACLPRLATSEKLLLASREPKVHEAEASRA